MSEEERHHPDDVREELLKKTHKTDISEIAESLEGKIPTERKEE